MRLRHVVLGGVATAALLVAAGWIWRAPLSVALAQRGAAARMAADPAAELGDGLHVGLCGAGSPFPDERRSGPCTLVLAGQRLFIFDAGSGAARRIGSMGFSLGRIEAVFLTHFHSDHIDGLGELMLQRWVSESNAAPLPVHGPAGVEAVVAGFMQAYAQDRRYRVAHHGAAIVPDTGFGGTALPFAIAPPERVVLIKDADLEIAAFAVDHAPVHPAVGYRIRYKGRSVVLSGDTRKFAAVQREAAGADLLVHEALSPRLVAALQQGAAGRPKLQQIFVDIVDYHSTPEQAAEIARDAKVRMLLLNHIAPPLPLPGMEAAFLGRAGEIYDGPLRVGVDGDFVSLPAGSTRIERSRRD
jgi:ribonuclease Z